MKNSKYLIFFGLIFYSVCFPQATLKIESKYSLSPNTIINVPVYVTGISAANAISLQIQYDVNVLQYKGVTNTVDGISFIDNAVDGIARFSWFSLTSENLTNAKLFDLQFTYLGGASNLQFLTKSCDIANNSGYSYPITYIDGYVSSTVNSVKAEYEKNLSFDLRQNYPNPFNPSTKIKFEIKKSAYVTLTVYNLLGQRIKTLINKTLDAGNYVQNFDATNLPGGVYFYKLQAGNNYIVKKMLLAK